MADDMDSDTYVGSKRSVDETQPTPDYSEIVPLSLKPDTDFEPKTSSFLVPDSPKKLKLSPQASLASGSQDFNMGFQKQDLASDSAAGIEVGLSGIQEPIAVNVLDAKKKQLLQQVEAFLVPNEENITSLKVELIDETALIQSVPMGFVNAKPQVNGKKARNQRRKEKLANRFRSEKKTIPVVEDGSSGAQNKKKISYSRLELEAMRFVKVAEQRKLWKDVYNGLGPAVAKEYDDLAVSQQQQQKNIQFNSDHCNQFGKMAQAPGILGVGVSRGRWTPMNVCVH